MRPTLLILGTLLLSACASVPSQSREASANRTATKLLSRSELRDCMDRNAALRKRSDALKNAHAAHDAESTVLSAEATALSKIFRILDTSDEWAVKEYNKRNVERNRKVERSNLKADGLNASSTELKSAQADYIAQCTASTYLRSDEEAILKEGNTDHRPLNQPDDELSPRALDSNDA